LRSVALPKVGHVRSAGIGYNLILALPMPPPSIGKASFMRGHCDHRTNCSSTKHKEGLRSLLAIGDSSMRLSAPLYHLKRNAKLLSRPQNNPLNEALDRIPRQQGQSAWSTLEAKAPAP